MLNPLAAYALSVGGAKGNEGLRLGGEAFMKQRQLIDEEEEQRKQQQAIADYLKAQGADPSMYEGFGALPVSTSNAILNSMMVHDEYVDPETGKVVTLPRFKAGGRTPYSITSEQEKAAESKRHNEAMEGIYTTNAETAKLKANEKPKGRILPQKAITDLAGNAAFKDQLGNLETTFKDEYAGEKYGDLYGEAKTALAKRGYGDKGRAEWWGKYQTWKNDQRHKLFGSALTATERDEFEKENIQPSTDPDVARENLARKKQLMAKAEERLLKFYKLSGYNVDDLEGEIMGLPPVVVGEDGELTAAPANAQPAAQPTAPAANAPKRIKYNAKGERTVGF